MQEGHSSWKYQEMSLFTDNGWPLTVCYTVRRRTKVLLVIYTAWPGQEWDATTVPLYLWGVQNYTGSGRRLTSPSVYTCDGELFLPTFCHQPWMQSPLNGFGLPSLLLRFNFILHFSNPYNKFNLNIVRFLLFVPFRMHSFTQLCIVSPYLENL